MDTELMGFLGISKDDLPEITNLDPKTCSTRQYVEYFIFPTLLPIINDMLTAAKKELVFERRITKFNACDYLTEWLYNKNAKRTEECDISLWEIPFVKEILLRKPRPPLPLSLIWSDEEAALVIQSFWRGYVARKDLEIQELRQYQKEMKETSYHIMFQVEDFWKKHNIEDSDENTEEEEEEDTLQKNPPRYHQKPFLNI